MNSPRMMRPHCESVGMLDTQLQFPSHTPAPLLQGLPAGTGANVAVPPLPSIIIDPSIGLKTGAGSQVRRVLVSKRRKLVELFNDSVPLFTKVLV